MRASVIVVFACQLAGMWVGETPSGWRVQAEITTTGDEAVAVVDLPDIGGFGRRFTGTATATGCRLHLERPQPAGRPPVAMDLQAGGDDQLVGQIQLLGASSPVILRQQAGRIPRHREEEVSFTNGAVKLSGTVIRPEGPGRYAAVVFTHGGGAETRASTQSVAVYLARRGVASIVYDKRGTGSSSGEWESASMEDLAGDALAAARLLRSLPDVDPDRIGIYGYSQGGWIAPLAATLDPSIAFVVAGGLATVNPMAQTIHHRTEVMRQEHFDTATIRQATALWRELYAARTAAERQALQERLRAAQKEPWFAASGLPAEIELERPRGVTDFLLFDPIPVWARVRQPVFVFWGSADLNVPVRESLRAIAAVAATDDLTARVYPGVPHDLRIASADLPRVAAPALYEDWVEWVVRRWGATR